MRSLTPSEPSRAVNYKQGTFGNPSGETPAPMANQSPLDMANKLIGNLTRFSQKSSDDKKKIDRSKSITPTPQSRKRGTSSNLVTEQHRLVQETYARGSSNMKNFMPQPTQKDATQNSSSITAKRTTS